MKDVIVHSTGGVPIVENKSKEVAVPKPAEAQKGFAKASPGFKPNKTGANKKVDEKTKDEILSENEEPVNE